jgi:hypothetical protein
VNHQEESGVLGVKQMAPLEVRTNPQADIKKLQEEEGT